MMHEAVRPVVIGILDGEVEEGAERKVRDAARAAPVGIDARAAMRPGDQREGGGSRIDRGGQQRQADFLQDDASHRPVAIEPARPQLLAAALPEEPIGKAGEDEIARRNDRGEEERGEDEFGDHSDSVQAK